MCKMNKVIKTCKIHGDCDHYQYERENKIIHKCAQCNREKCLKSRKDLKQKAIDYKGGSCSICGYNKCRASLDFHHLDPSIKEERIGRIWTWDKMKPELDKCILVCRNCHGELHFSVNVDIIEYMI